MMWKKVALVLSGMLIGCVSAAGISAVSAQSFPANPQAPRWEQYCEIMAITSDLNPTLERLGSEGWELIVADIEGEVGENLFCFKRPAP